MRIVLVRQHAAEENPDIPELVRGKTARVWRRSYELVNADERSATGLQIDNHKTKNHCLMLSTRCRPVSTLTRDYYRHNINKEVMLQAAESGYATATDPADYLMKKGIPFRDAHAVVGKTVQFAIREKRNLSDSFWQNCNSSVIGLTKIFINILNPKAMFCRGQRS